MQESALHDLRLLEQAGIAAEQQATAEARDRDQFLVAVVVAVQRVEPEQAQVAREPAEMHVEHEARRRRQRRAQCLRTPV